MTPTPDSGLPSLSDFLQLSSSDVFGEITRLVAEAFGGQAALSLLDIDGLHLHPTAIYPARIEEQALMGVGVSFMETDEHTLSRAVFGGQLLTMHREAWKGIAPVDGEHLAVVPVRMADQVIGVLLAGHSEPFTDGGLRSLEFMGQQAGAALMTAERFSDPVWRARRRQEPSLASQIQEDLLPLQEQYTPKFSMAGRIEPAYEIGGDWFDYALTDSRMFVAVADVSGKGIRAEHLANTAFGAVRRARRGRRSLPGIASEVGRLLEEVAHSGQFVTMLLAEIDAGTNRMELLHAGHPAPIVIPADPESAPYPLGISVQNPPVGALRHEEAPEYVSATYELEPGSRLLFYSDGLTERRIAAGGRLGEEGLAGLVESSRGLSPMPFVHDLLAEVEAHGEGELADDATAVMVEVRGAGTL
jgi:serine phosphatase RsbU (regulator of sigma subunit)